MNLIFQIIKRQQINLQLLQRTFVTEQNYEVKQNM